MLTPLARARSFSPLAMFALACLCIFPALTGCCHTPTVNTNVTADGHMLTETPTPGNSGPVWGFTVPRHDAPCGPAVAVIDVDGILLNQDMSGPASAGENPVSLFRERLDAAAADPCTRAVVVRINSPGGGVTASDIMRHDLERFKENTRMPVIACLMDIGTSGGYYLATAADQIVAHPTTVTGGVGVILNLYNLAGVEEKYDIGYIPIKSPLGGNIDSGTIMTRPGMMDTNGKQREIDQRDILQGIADQYQNRFKDVVIRARPGINANDPELFDGRIFSGDRAVQLHLVDSLGYLDDAVQQARNMAGVPDARIVMYHRCNDRARSPYSITPNVPIQGQIMTMNLPGLDRASLPTFLYLWQPEPTMEKKLSGR